jgi:glucose/arabinose dehydrogenase
MRIVQKPLRLGNTLKFTAPFICVSLSSCQSTPEMLAPASAVQSPKPNSPVARPDVPVKAAKKRSVPTTPQTIATGLTVPWALAFTPDGRTLVTERPGRIRVIQKGKLLSTPWRTLGVVKTGEMGLLGIALSPDFARNKHVFVVGTYAAGGRFVNRVIRLTDRQGRGADPKIIVDNIPAGPRHSGDAIAFGPDGTLYIATGDARRPQIAQNPSSLGGKILRYRPDGTIPPDNPFPGSPVYALGLRNPQGLAWDRATGTLFATDHGPSGFRNEGGLRHHDELNIIHAGANYGWPVVAGRSDDRRFTPPLLDWTPAIAPSGLAISGNSLYVGALKGQQLRRVDLARAPGSRLGWKVLKQQALFIGRPGRIRAVHVTPDGSLALTTSNRDDNSRRVYPGDDRVVRVNFSRQ